MQLFVGVCEGYALFVVHFDVLGVSGLYHDYFFLVELSLVDQIFLGFLAEALQGCPNILQLFLFCPDFSLQCRDGGTCIHLNIIFILSNLSPFFVESLPLGLELHLQQSNIELSFFPGLLMLKLGLIDLSSQYSYLIFVLFLLVLEGRAQCVHILTMPLYLGLHGPDFVVVGCDFFVKLEMLSVGDVDMTVSCFKLLLNLIKLVLQFCLGLLQSFDLLFQFFILHFELQYCLFGILEILDESLLIRPLFLQQLYNVSNLGERFSIITVTILPIFVLPPQCLHLFLPRFLILLLYFGHLGVDQSDAISQSSVILIIYLPALVHHLFNVTLIFLLLFHNHNSILHILVLLSLYDHLMQFFVFLLDLLLQFFDDEGHFFVVSTFFCLELADQAIYVVVFLLFQQFELHLVGLTLDFNVEMPVFLDSQQFMQFLLFLEALLDFSIFIGDLSLQKPNPVSQFLDLPLSPLIFPLRLVQLRLHFFFIPLHIPDSLLILLMDSSSSLDLIFQLMDGLFQYYLVVEQFFDLSHAVGYHYLQLLLLKMDGLELSMVGLGRIQADFFVFAAFFGVN